MNEKIEEIKERRTKRTQGRWGCGIITMNDIDIWAIYDGNYLDICRTARDSEDSTADANFIAHAPEDIDYLITEHERLEKENEELEKLVDKLKHTDNEISKINKGLRTNIVEMDRNFEALKFEMEKATLQLNKYHEKNYREFKLQRVCDCAEKKAQLIKESLCEPDKVLIYVEALLQTIKESKK